MRLSPQLLLGCVRLTVKTNWHSIFLDNVARSEHDAKGRKDYLVLHTSDFLERVSCQATQTALTSSSVSQLRVTSISQFKDLQEVCLETPWSRLHRSGEKPTVRPPLPGQGGGSDTQKVSGCRQTPQFSVYSVHGCPFAGLEAHRPA